MKASDEKEQETEEKDYSAFQLKWKSKSYWGLIFFNVSMVLLMAIDRIIQKDSLVWVAAIAVVFPIIISFFFYYIYSATKRYRDHSTIIKATRGKYFRWGVLSSFVIGVLTLLALVVSLKVGPTEKDTKIVVFVFIACCLILGTASAVLVSIYEFAVSFDILYHKDREAIVRAYLKSKHNLKIIEESEDNENQEKRE